MSPDSLETRFRELTRELHELEKDVAAMRSTLEDHERDVRQYAPSLIAQARMTEKLDNMSAEMRVLGVNLTDLRDEWRRDVEHFERDIKELRRCREEDRLDIQQTRATREERDRERERSTFRWRVGTIIAVLLPAITIAVSILVLLTDNSP